MTNKTHCPNCNCEVWAAWWPECSSPEFCWECQEQVTPVEAGTGEVFKRKIRADALSYSLEEQEAV